MQLDQILAETYWKEKRFDYTSGDLDYKGFHEIHKTAEGEGTWSVWKYTYSSGDLVRIEGPLKGSWTGRAALDWA